MPCPWGSGREHCRVEAARVKGSSGLGRKGKRARPAYVILHYGANVHHRRCDVSLQVKPGIVSWRGRGELCSVNYGDGTRKGHKPLEPRTSTGVAMEGVRETAGWDRVRPSIHGGDARSRCGMATAAATIAPHRAQRASRRLAATVGQWLCTRAPGDQS